MFGRFFTILIAMSFSANLLLGCTAMAQDLPSEDHSVYPSQHLVAMSAACGRSTEKHPGGEPFKNKMSLACKTLCTMMIESIAAAPERQIADSQPEVMPMRTSLTWDSSVDPPHPRFVPHVS